VECVVLAESLPEDLHNVEGHEPLPFSESSGLMDPDAVRTTTLPLVVIVIAVTRGRVRRRIILLSLHS
jgi:hypothetical protein